MNTRLGGIHGLPSTKLFSPRSGAVRLGGLIFGNSILLDVWEFGFRFCGL